MMTHLKLQEEAKEEIILLKETRDLILRNSQIFLTEIKTLMKDLKSITENMIRNLMTEEDIIMEDRRGMVTEMKVDSTSEMIEILDRTIMMIEDKIGITMEE